LSTVKKRSKWERQSGEPSDHSTGGSSGSKFVQKGARKGYVISKGIEKGENKRGDIEACKLQKVTVKKGARPSGRAGPKKKSASAWSLQPSSGQKKKMEKTGERRKNAESSILVDSSTSVTVLASSSGKEFGQRGYPPGFARERGKKQRGDQFFENVGNPKSGPKKRGSKRNSPFFAAWALSRRNITSALTGTLVNRRKKRKKKNSGG